MRNCFPDLSQLASSKPAAPFRCGGSCSRSGGIAIARALSIAFTIAATSVLTLGAARIGGTRNQTTLKLATHTTETDVLKLLVAGVNADSEARAKSVEKIQAALAGQSITGSIAYYTVSGVDHAGIRKSMLATRTHYTHGQFDANTEWHIHYRYTPGDSPDPSSSTFTATETITVTMPQWREEKQGDPTLIKTWDAYSRNLLFHEEGHYLIDEACLLAMRERVSQLPGNATFAEVDAVCKKAMREYAGMNDDYDNVTNHGATQGATF